MSGTKINLLVVDDEPLTRKVLSQIFEQLGHDVRCAEDGFSALQEIRKAMPDIVLSDLNMPGMSGFELLSVLRRRLPGIYVIATSGAYTGETVPPGIAADAFHQKATNFQKLADVMEAATMREGPPKREGSALAPHWVARNEVECPAENCVMISCPECLRAFPHVIDEMSRSHRATSMAACLYCHTEVHYAVVQMLNPVTSQPFRAAKNAVSVPWLRTG